MTNNRFQISEKGFLLHAINLRFIICYLIVIFFWNPGIHAQKNIDNGDFLFSVTSELKAPLRIALDNQGIIYVTDAFRKCILKYDNSGNFLEKIPTGGSPVLIAVSNDNQVVYSDNKNGRIMKIGQAGSQSEIYNGCGYPSSAAFDANNNLYIVDSKKKQVIVLDLSGNVLRTIGAGTLNYPTGIAIDHKNSRILVAEHGGIPSKSGSEIEAKILVFDLQGILVSSFGTFGSKDGEFSRIAGLAVDKRGQIYIVDPYQGRISIFNENGEYTGRTGGFGKDPGQLNAPMDIALDFKNRIWVTSMNSGSLEVFKAGELDHVVNIQAESDLLQNFPNPFSQGTWIPFILSRNDEVAVSIYNIQGALVRNLKTGFLTKGNYTTPGRAIYWDGTNERGQVAEDGVYFYDLKVSDTRKVRRMIFTK